MQGKFTRTMNISKLNHWYFSILKLHLKVRQRQLLSLIIHKRIQTVRRDEQYHRETVYTIREMCPESSHAHTLAHGPHPQMLDRRFPQPA